MTPQNKNIFGALTQEEKVLGRLLRPSWISGLMVIVVSMVVVVGTIAAVEVRSSEFNYLYNLQKSKPQDVSINYQTVNGGVSSESMISNVPLIILWGGVGLIVYWFTMSLIRAYKGVNELEQELNYVHANRQALIHQTVWTVLVRVVVLLTWFLYLQVTLHIVLPYAVAVGYAANGTVSTITGVGYVVWGISVLAVALHLHVVLLRLLFLRPRLFGNG